MSKQVLNWRSWISAILVIALCWGFVFSLGAIYQAGYNHAMEQVEANEQH